MKLKDYQRFQLLRPLRYGWLHLVGDHSGDAEADSEADYDHDGGGGGGDANSLNLITKPETLQVPYTLNLGLRP